MLSKILADIEFSKQEVCLADTVAYSRPLPIREFDQIYMMSGDMLGQTQIVKNYLPGKKVLFLGDGDGMSKLFGLLASQGLITPPKSLTVLDFDKRIVTSIEKFGAAHGFKQSGIVLEAVAYNVINPPDPKHAGAYDFFYINPPYGSKNHGYSTILWLHRCMEMCTANCSGCIVIPYDEKEKWSHGALLKIQQFLANNGFVIRDMVSNIHQYHLEDNPVLQSASIVVDRVSHEKSEWEGKGFGPNEVTHLYGKPRRLAQYIEVDLNNYNQARPDFNWKFGLEDFWDEQNPYLPLND